MNTFENIRSPRNRPIAQAIVASASTLATIGNRWIDAGIVIFLLVAGVETRRHPLEERRKLLAQAERLQHGMTETLDAHVPTTAEGRPC